MHASSQVDPVAGLAFLRDGPLFVCVLAPRRPGDARLSALMAFAFGPDDGGERFDAVLDYARGAGGRHYAAVVERLALREQPWPSCEPVPAARYVVERGGFILLAPSVEAWVSMPPERRHHLVQLIAAWPANDERGASQALATLGCCGFVGRVRAVLHGDSGAEIDAVVCDERGLRAGWFVAPTIGVDAAATQDAEPPAAPTPTMAPPPRDRTDLLNQAIAAYLSPSPSAPRLESWLRTHAPSENVAAVFAALDAAVATATDALWNETPSVSWSDAFERRLLEHVSSHHAWLTSAGESSLLAYARWLVWHEGLTSPASE